MNNNNTPVICLRKHALAVNLLNCEIHRALRAQKKKLTKTRKKNLDFLKALSIYTYMHITQDIKDKDNAYKYI